MEKNKYLWIEINTKWQDVAIKINGHYYFALLMDLLSSVS